MIHYIETGLFEDAAIMHCLMTEIENYFTYTVANVHIGSNILDNDIDTIQCLEVITTKVAKKKDRELVWEMFITAQI